MRLFFSTYFLIFISELPDKTALATLMLAARNHPLGVFVGVAAAYLVQSLVAITLGSALGYIPANWVHLGSGIVFIILALLMWFRKEENEAEVAAEYGISKRGKSLSKTATTSFVVIFLAEWGDLTQIGTATLVAKYGNPWVIFTAATLALWTASALLILVGHHTKHLIKPDLLRRIAAVIFAGVGLIILAGIRL